MSIPFLAYELSTGRTDGIATDCFHPGCLNLSHWRGASPRNVDYHGDTSTAIALQWLEKGGRPQDYAFVTSNHFDIDGFLAMWCLQNPEAAVAKARVLRQVALIGDFRELDPFHPATDEALRLACWFNQVEKQEFYPPFGEYKEEEACVPKYEYFLPRFEMVLAAPQDYIQVWGQEYEQVKRDLFTWESEATTIKDQGDIRLRTIMTPEPLHYYALFAQSQHVDMVLSIYDGKRYELEYKYSTWVDTTRLVYPRIDLKPLAESLQALEGSDYRWHHDDIADSGPILRLDEKHKNKAQRFASPTERPIHASSIEAYPFCRQVINYYRDAYRGLRPRRNWTWEEMRAVTV